MIQMLAKDIEGDFKVEPFYNGSMFKQGTDWCLAARQPGDGKYRPNISKQIPAWSILTPPTYVRTQPLERLLRQRSGRADEEMVGDEVKVRILGPTFFGTRQVGLKPREDQHPRHMAGVKLRIAPRRCVAALGRSLGAIRSHGLRETIRACKPERSTAQDNPLPNVQAVKFYEVMSQIVLTSHLVGFDLLTVT